MRTTSIRLTLFLLLLGSITAIGQTKKQFLQSAEEMWEVKNYYAALVYYKTVADAWPEDTDVVYRTAEAARMYNSYLLAETLYQQVLDADTLSTNQKADSLNTYPEAYLHLAGVKRNLGKYSEAITLYEKYDQVRSDKSQSCAKEIASCQYAISAVRFQIPMDLVPIGINTEYAEIAPLKIGDTLYYSSMNVALEDKDLESQSLVTRIYESSNDAIGKLLRAEMQEGNRHITHTAFNEDQSQMYFSICNNVNETDYTCQLFVAKREGGVWITAERLPDVINKAGYSASQPAYVKFHDGREGLYFASDAPGGKGKMDIWFSALNEAGQFASPVNMAEINTPDHDITPYFHIPSQRLFFSSEGYPNLGGFDIYEVTFKNGNWSSPKALPIPFNSSYHDLYFSMTEDGEYMYLASNRDTPGTKYIDPDLQSCCNDIFRAVYQQDYKLIANAFKEADKMPLLGTTIQLQRKSGFRWVDIDEKMDPNSHSQEFAILPGQEYRLIGTKPGFEADTIEFNTNNWDDPLPLTKDLYLKQKDILLDVFTFDEISRLPLGSSTVRLYDMTDPANPILVDEATNTNGNNFTFPVMPGKTYEVRGSSDGYQDAIAQIDTRNVNPDQRLKQDLYLGYKSLAQYIPLTVYFDNDSPGRRQRTTTTTLRYDETYTPYLERENEYIEIFTSILTEQEQYLLRQEIRSFFKDHVRQSMRELNNFCDALLRDLERGSKIEVTIDGYTSPRAESDYNTRLGGRRASSVENYIRSYNGGAVLKYIKSGHLAFIPVSYGETKVPQGVSDDLDDERQSIYSIDAARERRAEIKNVKVIPKT